MSMYVLMIARGYPTKKYKMNGIFEFDQAKAVASLGHKVVFAAVDVRSIRRWRKWGIERFQREGVYVYVINIPCGRLPNRIVRQMSYIGLNLLYNLILWKHGEPDLCHAHFTGTGYIASLLKQRTSVPLVITEHWSSIMKPSISQQLFDTAAYAYGCADAVVAVSSALRDRIEKEFRLESICVPNIVDTNIFTYLPREDNDSFSFVSVGGLVPGKRMDMTIRAFHEAFHGNPHVTLTVFGEGAERSKLEQFVREHRLENQVVLKGLQSREVIADSFKVCDCFVLASRTETFGVAYVEALASGVPVIATRCGGPEDFVHEDNGCLIPIDDLGALVEAMKYMYTHAREYDREKISREAKARFSPENVASQLVEVYEMALTRE